VANNENWPSWTHEADTHTFTPGGPAGPRNPFKSFNTYIDSNIFPVKIMILARHYTIIYYYTIWIWED
jgi:hypothetical protein